MASNKQEDLNLIRKAVRITVLSVAGLALMATLASAQNTTSKPFSGAKVNGGTVTYSINDDGKAVLTLSDDFTVPATPDPHWQVVDSKGAVFTLQRLSVKSGLAKDRINTSITLPAYIRDVAKVQIYCAWAEAVLGEATFDAPLMVMNR
jgi:hypothetical protein